MHTIETAFKDLHTSGESIAQRSAAAAGVKVLDKIGPGDIVIIHCFVKYWAGVIGELGDWGGRPMIVLNMAVTIPEMPDFENVTSKPFTDLFNGATMIGGQTIIPCEGIEALMLVGGPTYEALIAGELFAGEDS